MKPVTIRRLVTQEVEHAPETLEPGVIYVSERFGLALHLCACGCGEETVTPFRGLDAWTLSRGPNGVTLHPSIGQRMACAAHYWITDGEVRQA